MPKHSRIADSKNVERRATLHRTGNLAGTQATGAGVNTLRCTVYDSLNTLYVWLPSSVGTSVGVGNLDAESYVLAANFTFCHFYLHLLKGIFHYNRLILSNL